MLCCCYIDVLCVLVESCSCVMLMCDVVFFVVVVVVVDLCCFVVCCVLVCCCVVVVVVVCVWGCVCMCIPPLNPGNIFPLLFV